MARFPLVGCEQYSNTARGVANKGQSRVKSQQWGNQNNVHGPRGRPWASSKFRRTGLWDMRRAARKQDACFTQRDFWVLLGREVKASDDPLGNILENEGKRDSRVPRRCIPTVVAGKSRRLHNYFLCQKDFTLTPLNVEFSLPNASFAVFLTHRPILHKGTRSHHGCFGVLYSSHILVFRAVCLGSLSC